MANTVLEHKVEFLLHQPTSTVPLIWAETLIIFTKFGSIFVRLGVQHAVVEKTNVIGLQSNAVEI